TNRSFLPVPDILRTDAHGLVTPVALTDREWEVLAGELRQFLGRDGYLWLASLAIYPALQWDITLYLGATIKGADDLPLYNEVRAAALTQLPWLQEGVRRLIATMPSRTRSDVVAQLWELIRGIDSASYSDEKLHEHRQAARHRCHGT